MCLSGVGCIVLYCMVYCDCVCTTLSVQLHRRLVILRGMDHLWGPGPRALGAGPLSPGILSQAQRSSYDAPSFFITQWADTGSYAKEQRRHGDTGGLRETQEVHPSAQMVFMETQEVNPSAQMVSMETQEVNPSVQMVFMVMPPCTVACWSEGREGPHPQRKANSYL